MTEEICNCMCHRTHASHILPCCRGACKECGQYIRDFKAHKETCSDAKDPVMGLLESYCKAKQCEIKVFKTGLDELFGYKEGRLYHWDGEVWIVLSEVTTKELQEPAVRKPVKGFLSV